MRRPEERNQRITQLGARALPAEEGAHGRLCTRSRYRLPWNHPERQGPRKAACSLRCSPASLVLLSCISGPLVFLLPRLSFGSVCRAQARAQCYTQLCAGTSVPDQASALRYCSRQPRSWLAVKVFRVAGSHSLPSRLCAPAWFQEPAGLQVLEEQLTLSACE